MRCQGSAMSWVRPNLFLESSAVLYLTRYWHTNNGTGGGREY